MINGEITLIKGGRNLIGRVFWESESNGSIENSSTVTAKVQIHRQAGFTTTGTWKGSINVGGKDENINYYGSVGSEWVTIKTITVTIPHNEDGTGTCYIYSKVIAPTGTSLEGLYITGSQTVSLEYIPRYARIVSIPQFSDEENPEIYYSNLAGDVVEKIEVSLSVDGESLISPYREISGDEEKYKFLLTDDERDSLLSNTSEVNSLPVFFLLRSYIDGSEWIDKYSSTMNVVNAEPSINPEIYDINETTVALTGDKSKLIALHSVANISVNATPKKHATIKSVKVEHGETLCNGNCEISVTNNPIKITVVDSRGKIKTYTATNDIIPYFEPTCIIENSMPNGLGELSLLASGKIFDGSFGSGENEFVFKYRFYANDEEYGTWFVFDSATLRNTDYLAESFVTGLDYKKTYTFQAAVFDSLHPNGVLSEPRKFVSTPRFYWGENDFSFNVPVYYLNKLLEEWFLNKSGDTMQGILNMGGNRIVGLPEPVHATDVVTKSYADKSTQIQKVWENENPSQAVGKQTLEVDLSGFQMVAIEYQFNTTTPRTKMAFGAIGSQVALDFISKEFNMGLRICVPYANKVEIQTAAYSASSADPDKYMIPTRIFGIKGIDGIEVIRAICGTFVCGAVIAGQ